MKQRLVRFGLILAAAMVWGAVLWKALRKSTATPVAAPPVAKATLTGEQTAEPLKLELSRDPLLGEVFPGTSVRPIPLVRSWPQSPSGVPERQGVRWPRMEYKGMIHDHESSKCVILVVVDGEEAVLVEGSSLKGITVAKAHADSLLVQQGGQELWLKMK